MATKQELFNVVNRMRFLPNSPVTKETIGDVVDMFFVVLKDLSPTLLDKAVLFYLGQANPFFPMPGTLRQKALELQVLALRLPTPTEAWGMVLNRSFTTSTYCEESARLRELITSDPDHYWNNLKQLDNHEKSCSICCPATFEPVYAHPLVARTVRTLGGLDAILTDNQVADRARFIDAYKEILGREMQIIGMVREVREYIEAESERLLLEDERRAAFDTGERVQIMKQLAEGMHK